MNSAMQNPVSVIADAFKFSPGANPKCVVEELSASAYAAGSASVARTPDPAGGGGRGEGAHDSTTIAPWVTGGPS
jgi:hypothetical protein